MTPRPPKRTPRLLDCPTQDAERVLRLAWNAWSGAVYPARRPAPQVQIHAVVDALEARGYCIAKRAPGA